MKRTLNHSLILTVVLAMALLPACGKKAAVDQGGTRGLLSMVPQDATGIIAVNLDGVTRLDVFKKKVQEWKTEGMPEDSDILKTGDIKSYQEFVEKTGIDPEKDLHAMVLAMFQPIQMMGEQKSPDMLAIIKVTHDREKVLALIKETGDTTEETYGGMTLYHPKDSEDAEMAFTFVSEELMAAGKQNRIKAMIDLTQKGGKTVLENDQLKPYLESYGADALGFFVFDFPDDLKQPQQEGLPFKMDLSKAETLVGFFDYSGNAWKGEIKLISPDEEANKQIVNLLNGFKGMAALAGPEVAELVGNLNLTSSADSIKLSFAISDDLLEKVQKKMQEKSSGMMTPEAEPTGEGEYE